jgi:AraC-like DNA-binding protein
MKHVQPTLPASYVKTFLDGIKMDQPELSRLLRQVGISENLLSISDARITQEQFSTLFRALVDELDDEMPGLYGRPLRKGTLKVLIILLLDSSNLKAALRRWQQFDHILSDHFSFQIHRTSALISLSINNYLTEAKNGRLVQEFHLKLVHGIASWVIGKKIHIERVDFAFPRPLDASEYVFIFSGPVYFDQPVTAMHIKASYFDEPVQHRSKLELRDFLFKAPQNWYFVAFDKSLLSHQVRRYLESNLNSKTDTKTAAKALNLSDRTLGRRLMEEGTSFHQVKDVLRRDVAVHLLVKTKKSLDTISAVIGFSNVTVFHRAFKAWTGGTPREYRERRSDARH